MLNVYIFKCKNNKYYVSKSKYNYHRINDDLLSSEMCEWTKKHKIIDILKVYKNSNLEDIYKYTLLYMKIYGVQNVRNCNNTSIILNSDILNRFKSELNNKQDVKYNNYKKRKELKNNSRKKKLYKIQKNKYNLSSKNYNHIKEYNMSLKNNYEEETDPIYEFSTNYVNGIINQCIENKVLENNLSTLIVDDIIKECIDNQLIKQYEIIDINDELEKNIINNSYLTKFISYFGF